MQWMAVDSGRRQIALVSAIGKDRVNCLPEKEECLSGMTRSPGAVR